MHLLKSAKWEVSPKIDTQAPLKKLVFRYNIPGCKYADNGRYLNDKENKITDSQ